MKSYLPQPDERKPADDLSSEALALLTRIRRWEAWVYCHRESPRGKLILELGRAGLVHVLDGGQTIGVPPHGRAA